MATVLLIIHIMIALALIGVVLLQRSEGGALGIGGGGGGFMTGRGARQLPHPRHRGAGGGVLLHQPRPVAAGDAAGAALNPRSRCQASLAPISRSKRRRRHRPRRSSLPPIDLSKTDPGGKGPPEEGTPKVPQSK